jgi:hypothetical protein
MARPFDAERDAPVVKDERDTVAELQLVEKAVQKTAVVNEAVGVGTRIIELV